jgi:hypothetical protein
MLLREAIEVSGYRWEAEGKNIVEAMMRIFQITGKSVEDSVTKQTYRRLDLMAALDHVFAPRSPAKS